jgi:hypothetical protein
MSIEIERAIERQTQALIELTDAINTMTVTNQKVLMLLLEIVGGDDPDQQPQVDMEGNPV